MRIRYILSAILLLMATGCTKDFHLTLKDQEPVFVIEGRIGDLEGPYYVRVTRSTTVMGNNDNVFKLDSAVAVRDAFITISDDLGMIDTLKPSVERNPPRYEYNYRNGKMDSTLRPYINEHRVNALGFYETTKIKGVAGHTYQLNVRVGDKEFHASAYMPFVPALDSVGLKLPAEPLWDIGETIPVVYFREPQQEKNYYLLQHNPIDNYTHDYPVGPSNQSQAWDPLFYVVDDKTLSPYVNGLAVWEIWPNNFPYTYYQIYVLPYESVQVRLSSLTKETYEYFRALVTQYENDGNVYKPLPASAKGNISGNALGLFYATSVSYKLILQER